MFGYTTSQNRGHHLTKEPTEDENHQMLKFFDPKLLHFPVTFFYSKLDQRVKPDKDEKRIKQ